MILYSSVLEDLIRLFPKIMGSVEENIPGRTGRNLLEATKVVRNEILISSTDLSGLFPHSVVNDQPCTDRLHMKRKVNSLQTSSMLIIFLVTGQLVDLPFNFPTQAVQTHA